MTSRLRPLVGLYVDGRTYEPGDVLEVDEIRASVFVAYGLAAPCVEKPLTAEQGDKPQPLRRRSTQA